MLSQILGEGGIEGVDVLLIQSVGDNTKRLTKSLVVHDFASPQELDGFPHIGIGNHTQDIVIGGTGLLLRYDCR